MSEPTAFPLDESKLPFKIPKDTKPREKIMKLGQMITDRVPAKLRRLTVEDPEYWGLASIVTDEMAGTGAGGILALLIRTTSHT